MYVPPEKALYVANLSPQKKLCMLLICATHHKETLSVLITEIATNIANYMNHVHCTILFLTLTKSLLSKIQRQLYFNFYPVFTTTV